MLAGLTGGRIRLPDSVINYGNSPLPQIPPGASQMYTADGLYNHVANLLPMGQPYAYGNSARISTQTQMAHPNRVALIIPKLYIPAPESDGHDSSGDPILEHAVSDGDLVFTFRMGAEMAGYGSSYCEAPYGHAGKAVPLMNLATVNYILWGLQVGMRRPKNRRWSDFFNKLTQGELEKLLRTNGHNKALDEATVWSFIRTYMRPFGIQHGGDQQGGMHEGDGNRIVTHGAVDYVSSFAIEGRLEHVNNLWRDSDVHENDDLILALRHKPQAGDLFFNLSSSVRSSRTERVPVTSGYFYLRPETLQHRSFADACYVYVGRSFKYCSMYMRTPEAACWDARVAVVPGAPIMLTFEPDFVDSEDIYYASLMFDDCCEIGDSEFSKHKRTSIETMEMEEEEAANKKKRKKKTTAAVRTGADAAKHTEEEEDDDDDDEEAADGGELTNHSLSVKPSIAKKPKNPSSTLVAPKTAAISGVPVNNKLTAMLDAPPKQPKATTTAASSSSSKST